MAPLMIIPNGTHSNSNNHHHHPYSMMIPIQESQPSSSSSVNNSNSNYNSTNNDIARSHTTSAATTTTFSDHSPNYSNIGVVSPLIYAPPAPSSTLRTVSSSSSSNNNSWSGTVGNQNPHHFNPITPTPAVGAPPQQQQRITEDAVVSNYNWFDHQDSHHIAQQQRPSRCMTMLHPSSMMTCTNSTTTTTPKHERYVNSTPPFSTEMTVLQQSQSDQYLSSRSGTKKQRTNHYIAPRHIPDTFNSRVGTCCWSTTTNNNNNTNNNHMNGCSTSSSNSSNHHLNPRVQLRRQLSSGKIESFLSGNHSSTDTAATTSSGMMDVDNSNNNVNMNNGMNHATDASSQQQQQQRPRSMSF